MKKKLLAIALVTAAMLTACNNNQAEIDYDKQFEPIPDSLQVDVAKAQLGERMFNDTRISLDNTISCATCHVLEKGGADHAEERVSEGINASKGTVNAPTVYNAYFHQRQFWNGRAGNLQEQAAGPPTNPVEMGDQTWDQIVQRLREDKALVADFEKLYPGEGITQNSVTDAIAEYEKLLITPNCAFDRYLKGDKNALTADEMKGYRVFAQNCASCHSGVVLGGKLFEKFSTYGDYFADRSKDIQYNSDDDGLKSFSGKDSDLHLFKVPTLRNITCTAPYLHDGTVEKLDDAVRVMGKYQVGKDFSDDEVTSIVTFLHTLTGNNKYFTKKQ